jgi:hypothetical protein
MKTVTVEQFLTFNPCYGEERIRRIAERTGKTEFTALDILAIPRIPNVDRLWAVSREELIDAHILHEFACRCAERALARVDNPDPRSVAAIEAKRAWLRGEITNDELAAARAAASDAAWAAASAAASAAWAAASDAAWAAANAAASAAWAAAWAAASAAASDAARDAEYKWQVAEIKRMLREVND